MPRFHQRAAELRRAADRLGVLLDGGWTALGDAAMWLCGMQRILYGQMDEPDFIEQVLDTILEWELKRIDLLLEAGIDVLVHMAWYESTDFWSPRTFRKLLRPRLQVEIDQLPRPRGQVPLYHHPQLEALPAGLAGDGRRLPDRRRSRPG